MAVLTPEQKQELKKCCDAKEVRKQVQVREQVQV